MRLQAMKKNVVIRASAGSGKTYQLTNRLLALLVADVPPETILATTFSRKAAAEILDRLLSRLAEAAVDPEKCRELTDALGREITPQRCLELLDRLIRSFHVLHVRTLDSFFVRAAQALSFELGLWPDWQIDEGQVAQELVTLTLAELLRDRDRVQGWIRLLFKGQAVRSITRQLRDLIEQYYEKIFLDAKPHAWKMLPKQPQLSQKELAKCLKKLRAFLTADLKSALANAIETDIERVEFGDWQQFLSRGIAAKVAAGETLYKRTEIPHEIVRAYEPLIRHAKAVLANRVVEQTQATYELLAEFDERYQTALRERGALRFGDVARLLRDYLHASPELGRAQWEERLGWQIRHLLLDEFQDTSSVQWAVVAPFAHEVCRSESGSFFCVGDVKQSIYGWRGSEPGIFARIEQELPHLCVESLDTSWRSSPVIIDVVNAVFSSLPNNRVFTTADGNFWTAAARQWAQRFQPHRTARTDYPGYCCVIVRAKTPTTEDPVDSGEESFPSAEAGDSLLVDWVGEVYNAPSQPTIGILVRKNETIERIVPRLRAQGFQVSQEGRNPVTSAVSVQLILNLLRIADHPGDTAAAFRVGYSPLARGIGWEQFPCWDSEERNSKARELSQLLRRRILEVGYGPVIREFAETLSGATPEEEHLWLEKLVELAYLYGDEATLRTRDFLGWLDHQEIADPQVARIRVMTIHGAKGLQFDAVFLPDLDAQIGRRQGDLVYTRPAPGEPIDWVCRGLNQDLLKAGVFDEEVAGRYDAFRQRCIEEDLSVLYVAMTRAVYALYVFVAPVGGRASPPRTLAGIIWNGLGTEPPQNHGEIIFETGTRKWWEGLAAARDTATSPPHPVRRPALARRSGPVRRSVIWKTPHEMEGARSSAEALLRLEPRQALTEGSLIHAWFSQVRWLDQDGFPSPDRLQAVATQFPELLSSWDRLRQRFLTLLATPVISRVLSLIEYRQPAAGSALLPAQNTSGLAAPNWKLFLEQPFVVPLGDTYCRGQFDRVVVLYDGSQPVAADIIDFKTDKISAEEVPGRAAFYHEQLELYRGAAAEWLHIPPGQVSARLLFVEPGVVHRVG